MKVTVYHPVMNKMNPLAKDGYVYKSVGSIESDEKNLFRSLQNDFNEEYRKLGVRSCMVGDIYQTDDKFFMLEGFGIKEIKAGVQFILADQPLFVHDCDNCIFLGQSTDYTFTNEPKPVDLYACLKKNGTINTLISRHSSFGPDYSSGLEFAKAYYNRGEKSGLAEAYKRVKNLDLL